MYGKSTSNEKIRSPYSNQIIDAIINRTGRDNRYDLIPNKGEVHNTVMQQGRTSGVCVDTICSILTDAGLNEYLPKYELNGQRIWSSDNDYLDEQLSSSKGVGKHWDTVIEGNVQQSIESLEAGDWIIASKQGENVRRREWMPGSNPSGKHSLIVLDKTEHGVLFAHGHSGESDNYSTDTIFIPYESTNEENKRGRNQYPHLKANSYIKAFRFNPKEDVNEVNYKNEVFSNLTYNELGPIEEPIISELE